LEYCETWPGEDDLFLVREDDDLDVLLVRVPDRPAGEKFL
jgi:hypothetical protein